MTTDEISLKKYICTFTCMYGAMHFLLMVAMYAFNIENGSSLNMPMLLISAFAVSKSFIHDHHRAFTKSEVRFLSASCTAISFAVSIIINGLFLYFEPGASVEQTMAFIQSLPIAVWAIIITVVALIYYFILWFLYGWATNKAFAKQLNQQM